MSQAAIEPRRPSQRGEPAWEIVDFFPVQGDWTEEEYLRLSDRARAEIDDGAIELLPVPTKRS